VPLRAIIVGEFGALLVTVTVPVKLPVVVGANFAPNVVLAPAANVAGVVNPLTVKPAPLALRLEIVSEAFPVFVSVKVCDWDWPSATLPKLKVDGETCRFPVGVVVPVPTRFTTAVGVVESVLVIAKPPVTVPAEVGLNVKPIFADCPALRIFGVTIPVTPNSVPVSESMEIVRSLPPTLDTVTLAEP
jgi:hypothetical protein